MRLAIVDPDPVAGDVLAYAARRRGHLTVSLRSPGELFQPMPFTPTLIVLNVPAREATTALVREVMAVHPGATIFAAIEQPPRGLAVKMLDAGVSEVFRVPFDHVEVVVSGEKWGATRARESSPGEAIRVSDIEVAPERFAATKNGRDLGLTNLELRLLYSLCEHYPNIAPTDRLLSFAWEPSADPDASLLKTHISHLRSKLGEAEGTPVAIISRHGVGYLLQCDVSGARGA